MKILIWIIINGTMLYFLTKGEEWQLNIWKFWFWVSFVSTILALFMIEGIKKSGAKPSVPISVYATYGAVIACLLASNGWFWYAGFCAFKCFCQSVIFQHQKTITTGESK